MPALTARFARMYGGITPILRSVLLVAMMALVAISGASILGDLGPDADNDGIPDAVEVTEGTNPAVKDNDVFASHRLLVMQTYRDFLGREADAGGLAFWQGQLDGGMAPETFIEQIQGQPEFQARVAPVIRLYLTAFNRRPDHDGLTYWARQFAGGTTLEAIATAFAASPEFLATYGSLTNRQFIELLYLNTLNRPGDVRGVDFWTVQLENGARTRGQMLAIFSESPENIGVSEPEVLVAMAYAGMMNRTADIDGYNFWVDRVTLAYDRVGLIRAFYVSQEYHNRFLPAPTPPTITSANATTFYVGAPGTFTVAATGVPPPGFTVAGALPAGVTFNNTTGVLSGTPAAGTAGTYSLAFTASNGQLPNATQAFTLTVSPAVAITSAAATAFTVGTAGSFTVTTSSTPVAATITQTGALPTGVTFVNNGNGTATLAGTPAAGTAGTYPITITAANGVAANGTQNFVLTVNQAPAITSASSATFLVGMAGTHTVTASGFPPPSLSMTGALPAGVTFNPATGVLGGTPTAAGTFPLVFTAANGVGSNATQNFTLTIHQAPAITSANAVAFTVGQAGTFTITTTGVPPATIIGASGALPGGVTFTNNGNGTATLAGTPSAGTGGTYPITITASSAVPPTATQSFTLTVSQAPAITSANSTSFSLNAPGTFTVTATGFPAPTLSTAGPLPAGVTLSAAGVLSGTPTAAGTFNFTIVASNGVTPDASQGFTLTVTDSAIANDDAFSTVHGTTLVIPAPGVLGNDSGTPPLTVTAVNGVPANVGTGVPTSHGGVTLNADGAFMYIPTPGFAGTDTFTYVAQNASGSDTATVTITVTNAPAVVDLDGALTAGIGFGPVAFTEDGGPVAIVGTANPNWLTITDADGTTLASATIVLTNLQDAGAETLAVTCPSGPAPACSGAIQATDIVANATPTAFTITVTRAAPFADYEALLRTLTYSNASQNPTLAPTRDVTVTVNDGIAPSSPVAHATVTLAAVNDAPVLAAIEAGALAYGIGSPPTPVTSTLTVADVDSTSLAGATVQITANCVNADDVLVFAPQNGISGAYAPATCTMTLSGSSSVANYQAALRDVRFQNNNAGTSLLARTLAFQVNDGGAANNLSNVATRNLTLTTNGAPVLTAGAVLNYTEAQAPTVIDNTVTITDGDSASLVGATVQITGNCLGIEDVLAFANQNGISGVYSAGTCLMTLSGSATLANYQAALRSVQYSNSSQAPSTLARTVTWQVNDGGAINNLSNMPTSTINVAAVNSAPVVTAGGAITYTENDAPAIIATALTVTDADSTNLTGATVSITGNFNASQDVLGFTNQLGITGSYNSGTGVLTLTGTTTVASYQAALRTVTYANTSDNPSAAARTVTWVANDGALPSAGATSTINVVAVNDAPVLAAIEGSANAYVENGAPLAITSTLTVNDPDNTNLAGATVTITVNCGSGQDVLGFTNQNGISGSYSAGTCTLTLTGSSSVANYQTALRSVTYANTSENPTNVGRTIAFQVNDGGAANNLSNTVTRAVTVTAVNDAPTATAFANLPAQAGIPITYPPGKLTGTDPEGTAVTVDTTPINVTNGTVTINIDGSFTFTPFPNAATGSFQYRVTDSGTPAPSLSSPYATVSFTVTGPSIYFVRNPGSGLANCTLGNECLFATAITNIGAGTNAVIFIGDGNTHTAGSVLNAGAQVIGQGTVTAQTFAQFFGIAAPVEGTLATLPSLMQSPPTVTANGGTTLTVGANNTLRGFNLGNTGVGGTALLGNLFGTLAMSDALVGSAGQAINLTTGTFNATLGSVTSGAGTNNVNLNAVAGTMSLGGGALSGATSSAFNVVGGTGSITYNGTIASGAGARSVGIGNKSGGTVTFNGAVTEGGTGISLTNNTGTTIAFAGTVVANTGGNPAFAATGGGTVTVTGSNSTLTTTTGTALNVANTTIGAAGMTFRSISSNGAPNGIVLNTTGATAGLTVTGDGGGASNGSGGVIQNSTGIGVSLTSTRDASLNYLNVTGSQDSGIKGLSLTNFTLNRSNVNNNGNSTADDGLRLGEASGSFVGVTGTVTISDSSISANAHNNVHIRNTSGVITSLSVTNSTFSNLAAPTAANAFLFEGSGTSALTAATLSGNTFANNAPQRALEVQSHDTATVGTFTVSGNTFSNNGIHASFTQDTSSSLTFRFMNNGSAVTPMGAATLHAVNVFSSSTSTSGAINGRVEGNFIGGAGGAIGGNAVRAVIQGRTAATLAVTNNTVRNVNNGGRGIDLQFLGPTAIGQPITTSDVTVTNNDVDLQAPAGTFPLAAIFVAADNQGSPAAVRANITGNNARNTTTGGSYDYPTFDGNGAQLVFEVVTPGATGQLLGSGGAQAQLVTNNPATSAARIYAGASVTTFAGPVNTPP